MKVIDTDVVDVYAENRTNKNDDERTTATYNQNTHHGYDNNPSFSTPR